MNSSARPRRQTWPVTAPAALVLALGAGAMLEWHLRSYRITGWLPGEKLMIYSMVYNTAVSFVVLGAALLAVNLSRRRLAAVLAVVGGLPSLLTLFEYVAGISLGIDQLVVKSGDASAYPGRIAPNTAVCLLLFAAAVLCMPRSGVSRYWRPGSPLLASLSLGLGIVSVAGYLSGVGTPWWGQFSPMTTPAAAGLVLLNLGFLVFCWSDNNLFGSGAPSWSYMAVTVAAMVMTVSLWQALASEEQTRIGNTVASQLEIVRARVLADMRYRIGAVERFARRWERTGLPDAQRWQFETGQLVNDVHGFEAIAWADPAFRIRWVYPLERNQALLGANLSSDGIRRRALETARDSRRTVVTPPIRLLAGGDGINAYVPIYQNSVFQGCIVIAFRFQDLFPHVVDPGLAPGYAILIYDGDREIYRRAPEAARRGKPRAQQASLQIENARWTLKLWPSPSILATGASVAVKIVLVAGLLLSLLLGSAVYLAQAAGAKTAVAERARTELEKEVAERRRAEQELDQFFMLVPDMLCIAGFDGYFKRINAAWEHTLGGPLDRLLTEPYRHFVHPDDLASTQGAAQDQKDGMSISSFENRYRAQDGSYRWFRWNSLPIPERQLIFAAARDVTAEKTVEEALRQAAEELERRVQERTSELQQANRALHEREELFRRLFEESPVGTALVDRDHRLTHVNKALCDLLAYDASALCGLTPEDVTHRDDLDMEGHLFAQMMAGGIPGYRLSKRYLRKDGKIVWGDLTASVLRDECGRPMMALGMIEDVTERRRRDEQIGQLNRELRARVEELTAVNQEMESFNYSISHDLRAPLRHIDGFSKILLEHYRAQIPDVAGRYLERICEGARRMGRMVDELLELSRTGRREMSRQPTGLKSLVDDVLEEMGPDLRERDIEWRIGELPFVECDPALIRQVFVNLLSNAVKFTRPRKPAIIQVGQTSREGEPVLFVRDNGVGFSMKYAEKLFGVFQRLHRMEDFEGTGVGLATVQRIIHRHGGRIWAEAALDQGATFYFTLADGRNQTASGSETQEAATVGASECLTK